ncbi:MAG: DUF3300 domain-containing protein [Steroidobacterales bacterium]
MKRRIIQWTAATIGAWALCSLSAGQSGPPPPDAAPSAGSGQLSPAQLDQLTAPVALYADPLLGNVLAAATYPLEVVEAARWLAQPANAALKGDPLTAALQQQSWDDSVKSLVSVPEVLRMMSNNLQWTEQLGDAFLAQQADVMDSVQRLRQRAAAAGTLTSTPQQTVSTEDQDILIEPATPDVVYVPYYVPTDVYGPWPWPDYPPFYFAPPPGIFLGGALIGFGIGFDLVGSWGWYQWNWHGHGFNIQPRRSPQPIQPWRHDPIHRRGVPYRESATSARFPRPNAGSGRDFRGFPQTGTPRPATVPAAPPPVERPAAPAFESFGRGAQVRGEAARGSSSRSAPAPRSAPASGFHGGGRAGGPHR